MLNSLSDRNSPQYKAARADVIKLKTDAWASHITEGRRLNPADFQLPEGAILE